MIGDTWHHKSRKSRLEDLGRDLEREDAARLIDHRVSDPVGCRDDVDFMVLAHQRSDAAHRCGVERVRPHLCWAVGEQRCKCGSSKHEQPKTSKTHPAWFVVGCELQLHTHIIEKWCPDNHTSAVVDRDCRWSMSIVLSVWSRYREKTRPEDWLLWNAFVL